VLAIGCHSDDIEIGCGGTIMSLIAAHPGLEVRWVVLSASGPREAEAREGARRVLEGAARAEVVLRDFADGYMPYNGADVKDFFESLTDGPSPDLVFTHQRSDLHQDHRLACELAWNTFRDHLILEYEIPKWDGDLGAPNVYVPLAEEVWRRKVAILMDTFSSQRSKSWFTEDLFSGLMRLRGMESRAPSGHAEAFYGRKLVLGAGASA
jgi:LmbE family N-acetylglucosaminyl deacetylase